MAHKRQKDLDLCPSVYRADTSQTGTKSYKNIPTYHIKQMQFCGSVTLRWLVMKFFCIATFLKIKIWPATLSPASAVPSYVRYPHYSGCWPFFIQLYAMCQHISDAEQEEIKSSGPFLNISRNTRIVAKWGLGEPWLNTILCFQEIEVVTDVVNQANQYQAPSGPPVVEDYSALRASPATYCLLQLGGHRLPPQDTHTCLFLSFLGSAECLFNFR